MFDHRLGLALGKSLTEIRAMPYPEYRSWYAFYLIEPFGWIQDEVHVARLLSMLNNTHSTKSKDPKDFMRFDYPEEVSKQLSVKTQMQDLPEEERRRRIKEAVMQTFGSASKAVTAPKRYPRDHRRNDKRKTDTFER